MTLNDLLDRLYCQVTRQTIRLVVLKVLNEFVTINMVLCEEQLLAVYSGWGGGQAGESAGRPECGRAAPGS